ncbi:hypothetical protein OEW28_00935 [Defluviimonas sp. WL0002]|uniref:Uncharacterized protein n=1 Tax=Albidovulum marisflavi TaxID=2984159 RepID=A0ABT2Z835_9RHOB|nr:hypothetical protein [Defluviimonas sp. WL0002]MCV2867190.1 hypothetical protein [Defluviimonas sp. WL0002]
MTPPRLHVITARDCAAAIVLRRGPSRWVASIGWNRDDDSFELGQWFHGRIYEHRCDLSPDGRHLVCFAGKGGTRWWTAVSRAPWLTSIAHMPQDSTWGGGGGFPESGQLWLNGVGPAESLPTRELHQAPANAFPHSTDGFHMGDTYAALMQARGWRRLDGAGYAAILARDVPGGGRLELSFALGEPRRAIVSNRYALIGSDGARVETRWEWADIWQDRLHYAQGGALWERGPDGAARLIRAFDDMAPARRQAPYQGVSR